VPDIRNVRLDELDRFAAIGDPETADTYRKYLTTSVEAGESFPSRWFIVEDEGEIVGRIIFWGLPKRDLVSLDVFALRWSDPHRAAGAAAFLEAAITSVRDQGVRTVTYERHEPDPDGHTPEALLHTLASVGFREVRRTIRLELSPVVALPLDAALEFRGLSDGVTIDDFAKVIARCAVDGDDSAVARRTGGSLEESARSFVDDSASMRGSTDMWRIAYARANAVGVIFPTANDGGPVLNYIGVLPEHRGNRLVDTLLAETALLHAREGAQRIRADTDVTNRVMLSAFARAGWEEFGRRTTFAVEL
jgi:ribosomal protein S18 acetylase RimI-like enzyme